MTRSFWFAMFVLILVCFSGVAAEWLSQPPAVHAMVAEPSGDQAETGAAVATVDTPVDQPAQAVTGSPPVIQAVVGLVVGLFGVLALAPFLICGEEGSAARPPAPPVRR